jgi:hypothetical protein
MEIKFIELKQRHVEAWTKELPDTKTTSVIVYNGAMVRAAFKAGWFTEMHDPLEVDDMPPGEVSKLASEIAAEFSRVMEVQKN